MNGSGDAEGSLINIAGAEAAANSYGTVAAIGDFPAKADFDAAFTEHFKADKEFNTPGAYSGPGLRVRHRHPEVARRDAEGQRRAPT